MPYKINYLKKIKKKLKSKRFLRRSRILNKKKRNSRKMMGGGAMSTFIVYGRMTCPYTREALDLLKNKNKSKTFYDIEQNQKHNKMLKQLKSIGKVPKEYNTVPVILNNDKFIGGKTELSMLKL